MRVIYLSALGVVLAFAAAKARAESTISIPVSASLSDVAAMAERSIPQTLVNETRSQTCVKAKRACTKIPEFRGFKIYSRMECVDLTPRIDCNIAQNVTRAGPISVTGAGPTLHVTQTFNGQATVSGRGEIGRHIRETANGTATISASITPHLNSDWTIGAQLGHSIDWPVRPKARLFNLFDVTFQSKATEELNKAIERYKTHDLPNELAKLDLRARLQPVWRDLQKPVAISLPGDAKAYLHFIPATVALAPPNFDNNRASTRFAITGRFGLSDVLQDVETVALPALSSVPPPAQLALSVPIRLGMNTLTTIASAELPRSLGFTAPVNGTMDVQQVQLRENDQGQLEAKIKAQVEAAGLGPAVVTLILAGTPDWNETAQSLSMGNPSLVVEGGAAAWFFNQIAATDLAKRLIADALTLSLADPLQDMRQELTNAMTRPLADGVSLTGQIDALNVDNVRVKNGLRLIVRAQGRASVSALQIR